MGETNCILCLGNGEIQEGTDHASSDGGEDWRMAPCPMCALRAQLDERDREIERLKAANEEIGRALGYPEGLAHTLSTLRKSLATKDAEAAELRASLQARITGAEMRYEELLDSWQELETKFQTAIQRAEKGESEILEAAIDRICADDSWNTDDVAWHACFPALFDIIRGVK